MTVEQKKGGDRGIDGRLYFHDEGDGGNITDDELVAFRTMLATIRSQSRD